LDLEMLIERGTAEIGIDQHDTRAGARQARRKINRRRGFTFGGLRRCNEDRSGRLACLREQDTGTDSAIRLRRERSRISQEYDRRSIIHLFGDCDRRGICSASSSCRRRAPRRRDRRWAFGNTLELERGYNPEIWKLEIMRNLFRRLDAVVDIIEQTCATGAGRKSDKEAAENDNLLPRVARIARHERLVDDRNI